MSLPILPPKFRSLTHARAVRDRLATWVIDEIASWQSREYATGRIDKVCQAGFGWSHELQAIKKSCQSNWNGNRIPDWSYFEGLSDAINYIAGEEFRAVKKL